MSDGETWKDSADSCVSCSCNVRPGEVCAKFGEHAVVIGQLDQKVVKGVGFVSLFYPSPGL